MIARTEFDEAGEYHEQQRQGLGDELRAEIREFPPRLQRAPLTFPVERGDVKRLRDQAPELPQATATARRP